MIKKLKYLLLFPTELVAQERLLNAETHQVCLYLKKNISISQVKLSIFSSVVFNLSTNSFFFFKKKVDRKYF